MASNVRPRARLMRRAVPALLLLALLAVLGLGRAFAAAPTAVGTIPAQALVIGGSAATVDVAAYFTDADMDTLTYAATSGDTDVVTVGVSGSTVTLTPAGTGSAAVTVTASDASDSVDQAMAVTVTHGCAASNPTASASGAHANVARDCETLLNLMDDLRGTATLNWAVGSAMGSWDSVTVDSSKGVRRLLLRNKSLTGVVPSALSGLSELTHLNLGVNRLSGTIPKELGGLTNLVSLQLFINQLSGGIPKELGSLANLTHLGISTNQLSGTIPTELGNLSNLTSLGLSRNQLSGSIPKQLGSLANLTYLQLDNNQLTGSIPAELGSLSNLQYLSLNGNTLSGSIPSQLGNLSNLQSLYLYDNSLNGSIPSQLGSLSNLHNLWFFNNNLSGQIPSDLGNLSNLQELRLDSNALRGAIPPELGSLSNLKHLSLTRNNLSGQIPSQLGNLSNLERLGLNGNNLSGQIPSDLGNLSSLQTLDLRHNNLSGQIPSDLGNLSSLQTLDLRHNNLSGQIPSQLGSLSNLVNLYLGDNNLSGQIPSQLGNLSNLRDLVLSNNDLSGPIPSQLGNLSNLRQIRLDGNALRGTILPQLGSLTHLVEIDLRQNQLSGAIPAQLGSLTNLRRLYLSQNQLSGAIPAQLGSLSSLRILFLGHNQLSGGIPMELGNLSSLSASQPLGLQCNRLSGAVPTSLASLPAGVQVWLQGNPITTPLDASLTGRVRLTGAARSGHLPAASWCGPPVFAPAAAAVTVMDAVAAGEDLGGPFAAIDPDNQPLSGTQTLTYTLSGPDAAAFTFAAATGYLRPVNALSGDAPADADGDNRYEVTISAFDGVTTVSIDVIVQVVRRAAPPPAKHPRLAVELSGDAGPVAVGGRIGYTFTLRNSGNVPLTGVFWRSPELGVARRDVGSGALAPGAEAVVTTGLTVTAEQLPGPLQVTFYGDSDQTDDPSAVHLTTLAAAAAAAVEPTPTPTPTPAPTPAPPPAWTLVVERVRHSVPDVHLAHNIPDLRVDTPDGRASPCGFLAHYDATGGLPCWGHAISEVFVERPGVLSQYYQRGVIDCRPQGDGWVIERRLVWDELGGGLAGAPDLGVEPGLVSEQTGAALGPWGHRVSNYAVDGSWTGFRDFFHMAGGVAFFGYPKTDARTDAHPQAELRLPGAAAGFVRQYFQAGVLEYHPGDPAQPVKLVLLGDLVRERRYPDETWRTLDAFAPAAPLAPGQTYHP